MGMSSSQARLLNLTGRMHQIEYKAAKLEAQKLQMANESRRVYNEYQQALEKTKVQFLTMTNNGGIDYADATLAGLENAIVHDTEILTSAKSFLLHNVNTNEIYLTSKVADALNIKNEETLTDKETYLNNHGVQKIPEVITKKVVNSDSIQYVQNSNPFYEKEEYTAYSYSITSGEIVEPQVDIVGYNTTGSVSAPYSITPYTERTTHFINDVTQKTEDDLDENCIAIHNIDELRHLCVNNPNLDGCTIVLMNDIDLNENGGINLPLDQSFTIDGNGYKVTNMYGSGGLFNILNNVTVKNLAIENAYIEVNSSCGILANKMYNSSIENCYVDIIEFNCQNGANQYAGGFVGESDDSLTIKDSYSNIAVAGNSIYIGAFVGSGATGATINNSYSNRRKMYGAYEFYGNYSTNINQLQSVHTQTTVAQKGEIDGAYSMQDIKEYLAFGMCDQNNSKTYEQYLDQLDNAGFSNYDYIYMSTKFGTNLIQDLINENYTSYENVYTSDLYEIKNQRTDDNFSVETKLKVSVSSKEDIIKELAVGVHKVLNSAEDKELSIYEDRIRANFTDNQLAALSEYLTSRIGSSYAGIIWALADNEGACSKNKVENTIGIAILSKFDTYTINFADENNIVVKEDISSDFKNKDKPSISIPTTAGIASNLAVAFRLSNKTISDSEENSLVSYLSNNYNDKELAAINKAIVEGTNLDNIYNHFKNGGNKPTISTSDFDNYYISANRVDGTCTVEYEEFPEETGNMIWDENDPNYIYWSNMYEVALKMQENKAAYRVIDDTQVNSKDYLNTLLANDSFVFIDFEKGLEGDNYTHTSVATDTRLREVTDESGLRKAEAKYEADMRRIDMKDRKYDYDLAALDNERNAIKNEMETLKTVAKDNVDRTFKLFG